jgi:hypothetical protein
MRMSLDAEQPSVERLLSALLSHILILRRIVERRLYEGVPRER